MKKKPRCIVIAGPNGAGKTTLARELLGHAAAQVRFVNADLIAAGLSPLDPAAAAIQAGKLLLGYHITIIFISLKASRLAKRRVALRVKQGGHSVAPEEIVRRFDRGRHNFESIYRPIADAWVVYDNSEKFPRLVECGP